MSTRELDTNIFGWDVQFTYSETWIGYSLFSLRVIMGWTFFYAGITKVINPEWSARGFLLYGVPDGNPFTWLWTAMANDWAWLLTPLNQVGLTLVGLALIVGAFVRFSAFWGALMMLFYWIANYPFHNSFLIDDHMVYVFLLFGLGAFGTGRILGLDQWIEQIDIVERYPRLKLFLG
jgi:thiosulfate dehydrogenase [quinone] large subunit